MHNLSVGVLGASGYTGREVLTILARHGGVDVRFATSDSEAGRPAGVPNLPLVPLDTADPESVDVLFLCLPHGEAIPWVKRFAGSRVRVIDLTADHRPANCPPPSRHSTLGGNSGAFLIRTAARRHS